MLESHTNHSVTYLLGIMEMIRLNSGHTIWMELLSLRRSTPLLSQSCSSWDMSTMSGGLPIISSSPDRLTELPGMGMDSIQPPSLCKRPLHPSVRDCWSSLSHLVISCLTVSYLWNQCLQVTICLHIERTVQIPRTTSLRTSGIDSLTLGYSRQRSQLQRWLMVSHLLSHLEQMELYSTSSRTERFGISVPLEPRLFLLLLRLSSLTMLLSKLHLMPWPTGTSTCYKQDQHLPTQHRTQQCTGTTRPLSYGLWLCRLLLHLSCILPWRRPYQIDTISGSTIILDTHSCCSCFLIHVLERLVQLMWSTQ